jgi:hypothetical protein
VQGAGNLIKKEYVTPRGNRSRMPIPHPSSLDDVRLADNDYLCKEQDVPQLRAGEEQIET